MVDRATPELVPDGWSSDEPATWSPVLPENVIFMGKLKGVGRGLDGKLTGFMEAVDPYGTKWCRLENEGDIDKEFWHEGAWVWGHSAAEAGEFETVERDAVEIETVTVNGKLVPLSTVPEWAIPKPMVPAGPTMISPDSFANEESRKMALGMVEITADVGFRDTVLRGHMKGPVSTAHYTLVDPGDPARERWRLDSVDMEPAKPSSGLLPMPGKSAAVPVPPRIAPPPPRPAVSLPADPAAPRVPDGHTGSDDDQTQINFRASVSMKRRLRLGAAKADMKVGAYIEKVLADALDQIETVERITEEAAVVEFRAEAIRTPSAQGGSSTLDLLRSVLKASGYEVKSIDAQPSVRNPPPLSPGMFSMGGTKTLTGTLTSLDPEFTSMLFGSPPLPAMECLDDKGNPIGDGSHVYGAGGICTGCGYVIPF